MLNVVLSKHDILHGTSSFSRMKNDSEMKRMLETFVHPYNLEGEWNLPEEIFEKLFNVISDCNRALYVKSHLESKLTHMIFLILAIIYIEVEANISIEERVSGKQVETNGAFEFLIRHGDIMCACVSHSYPGEHCHIFSHHPLSCNRPFYWARMHVMCANTSQIQ